MARRGTTRGLDPHALDGRSNGIRVHPGIRQSGLCTLITAVGHFFLPTSPERETRALAHSFLAGKAERRKGVRVLHRHFHRFVGHVILVKGVRFG